MRTMVVRNEYLYDSQLDSIASFAISKVGKPYNFGGFGPSAFEGKVHEPLTSFTGRITLLATGRRRSTGPGDARIHHYSIDLSPGDLAARVGDGVHRGRRPFTTGYHLIDARRPRCRQPGRDGPGPSAVSGRCPPRSASGRTPRPPCGTADGGQLGMVQAYLVVQVQQEQTVRDPHQQP